MVPKCGSSLSPIVWKSHSNNVCRRVSVQVKYFISVDCTLVRHRREQDRLAVQLKIFVSWIGIHGGASFVRLRVVVVDPRFWGKLIWRPRIAIISPINVLISSRGHHLHDATSLAFKYRLIIHRYCLPRTCNKRCSFSYSPWFPLSVCIDYYHLLLMLLPYALHSIADDLRHMGLLTS